MKKLIIGITATALLLSGCGVDKEAMKKEQKQLDEHTKELVKSYVNYTGVDDKNQVSMISGTVSEKIIRTFKDYKGSSINRRPYDGKEYIVILEPMKVLSGDKTPVSVMMTSKTVYDDLKDKQKVKLWVRHSYADGRYYVPQQVVSIIRNQSDEKAYADALKEMKDKKKQRLKTYKMLELKYRKEVRSFEKEYHTTYENNFLREDD